MGMEIRKIWVLRGSNYWTRFPALEAEVVLDGPESRPTNAMPGFANRLAGFLSAAGAHGGEKGVGETFWDRLERGTSLAHVLQHLTLLLQSQAGSEVAFGLAKPVAPPTFYRVVVEFEEESLARASLATARDLCLAALHDRPFETPPALHALRELSQDVCLGPSTRAIVRAASERNIPTRRLNEGSLVQLGQGVGQRRILTAETDRTGAIAEAIAQDKELTRRLLKAVGVPVPEGRPVADAEEAWVAAADVGVPVVVKPRFGNHGRGVTTNLSSREEVVRAYEAARAEGSEVIVETFIRGSDHRLLVVGDRLIAAARREPAQVVGDGRSSVRRLVEEVNKDPRRSDGHSTVLSTIKLDAVALAVLAEQGYDPDSVPPPGARVLIRRNGNLSTGGTATDVTDEVHPEVAARAVDAARVVGLDIAGVDVMVEDIGRPLEEQRGAVVEVNAGPGLRMHLQPSAGKPRAVGEAIIDMLFPEGNTGRIPVAAVTGVNGKTTTARLLAHILRTTGRVVGLTCTDGTYLFGRPEAGQPPAPAGRRIDPRDCSGPRSAAAVLLNPRVEAAVLETARGGILREGLGFDNCDVAVVTNVGGGDHFGLRGIETLQELARVKRVVVEAVSPTGAGVLNAADPLVAGMAEHCPGRVVYFALDEGTAVLAAHRRADGRAVFVRGGSIVLAEGEREAVLASLELVPLTHHGKVPFQVENVLAAAGAAWSLGVPLDSIRSGLASFHADEGQSPGRFNVFRARGATVVVDYAHNPSAVAALVASLGAFPATRRSIVFCSSNRRDIDVIEMGELLGEGFDRILLYRDQGNNDRADGELNLLLRRGIQRHGRAADVKEVAGEEEAIAGAFRDLGPGDLLVIGVDAIEDGLRWVRSHLDSAAERVSRSRG
jgi:cyanophycin synthetase